MPALVELGNFNGTAQGLGRALGSLHLGIGLVPREQRYPYYEDALTASKELSANAPPVYDPVPLREQMRLTVHGEIRTLLREMAERVERGRQRATSDTAAR